MRGFKLRGRDDADDGGTDTGEYVDKNRHLVDFDAREFRRLAVAADGEDMPAKRRLHEERCSNDGDDGKDQRTDGHARDAAAKEVEARVAERCLAKDARIRRTARVEHGEAARDVHRAERGDEGGDAEACDDL